MKAAMRLDPSQVARTVKYSVPASGTINRDLLIAAGLTHFDVMLIGAPGGRAGDATGTSNKIIEFGSGGGGGGSLRIQGNLVDLPQAIPFSLGSPGSDGANVGNDTTAGAGSDGGDAVFHTWTAFGGKGATGGKSTVVGSTPTSSVTSKGGAGGSNSLALGTGGAGGHGADYDQNEIMTSPTAGTWAVSGSNGGGRGGGGGRGAGWIGGFNPPYQTMGNSQAGAAGASGGDGNQNSPGGGVAGNNGGTGSGANAKPLTGVNEYYGGMGQNGLVMVKFS